MELPINLEINPILTAAVEIKIESSLDNDQFKSKLIALFLPLLPNIREGKLSTAAMDSAKDKTKNSFVLSNDQFIIAVSPDSLIFENSGEYKLWPNFINFISTHIGILYENSKGMDLKISRIGMRYGSVLPTFEEEYIPLNITTSVEFPGYTEIPAAYRTRLNKDDIKIHLQVASEATVKKDNAVLRKGLLIDIDVAIIRDFEFNKEIIVNELERMHNELKQLFFHILDPEYLEKLKPTYK